MDYGLPEPEAPTPPPSSLHPGCFALLVAPAVACLGALCLYVYLEVTGVIGWSGLEVIVRGLIVIALLSGVSFVSAWVWQAKKRQAEHISDP